MSFPENKLRIVQSPTSEGVAENIEIDSFGRERLRIAESREQHPSVRIVVAISDLDDDAAEEQAIAIAAGAPHDKPFILSKANVVEPYNEVAAAHALAARLAEPNIYPPGTIFVVTVDPHVGKNAEDGNNTTNKRLIVRHSDGTFVIGPNRAYLRVGEYHDRGPILQAVEIDKQKLIDLGFAAEKGNDVFDGLRRFAPAAAALLSGVALENLGEEIDVREIPRLNVPEGTVTAIESNYQNVRVEVPCDRFEYGEIIAIRDDEGNLLALVRRTQAFDGEKGDIVAANGSKRCIQHPGNSLYLVSVQGHLAEDLANFNHGQKIEIGQRLNLSRATAQDIRLWIARRALLRLRGKVGDFVSDTKASVFGLLERGLANGLRFAENTKSDR